MKLRRLSLLSAVVACSCLAAAAAEAGSKGKGKNKQMQCAPVELNVPVGASAPSPAASTLAPPAQGVIPDHGHGPGGGGNEGVITGVEGSVGGPTEVLVVWGPDSADVARSRRPLVLEQFAAIDADGDGLLSRPELEAHFAQVAERVRAGMQHRFDAADVDGSGSLDLAEVQTAMPCLAESFERLDADHDGYLELDELPVPRPGP